MNLMENKDGQRLDGILFASMVRGGAAQLRAKATIVNNLNVFPVPDGDTGDNMSMTIEGGVASIDGMQTEDLSALSAKLSQGMLLGARGNSGVILSQFFAGIAAGFSGHESADAALLGDALRQGVKQAYASVLTPTEGTILTVARESVEYAAGRITADSTIISVFADLTREMYDSLERTPQLLAALREADVVDSGGAGLYYIMQGLNRVLLGEELDEADDLPQAKPAVPAVDFSAFGPDSEMTYGYCTELLLQLQHAKCDIEAFEAKTVTE